MKFQLPIKFPSEGAMSLSTKLLAVELILMKLIIFGSNAAGADDLQYKNFNSVWGKIVLINGEMVHIDINCNGTIKTVEWRKIKIIHFDENCRAVERFGTGGTDCLSGWVDRTPTWELVVGPHDAMGYASDLVGIDEKNIYYIDISDGKKSSIPKINSSIMKTDYYCP